jgi:hypothetical protein
MRTHPNSFWITLERIGCEPLTLSETECERLTASYANVSHESMNYWRMLCCLKLVRCDEQGFVALWRGDCALADESSTRMRAESIRKRRCTWCAKACTALIGLDHVRAAFEFAGSCQRCDDSAHETQRSGNWPKTVAPILEYPETMMHGGDARIFGAIMRLCCVWCGVGGETGGWRRDIHQTCRTHADHRVPIAHCFSFGWVQCKWFCAAPNPVWQESAQLQLPMLQHQDRLHRHSTFTMLVRPVHAPTGRMHSKSHDS